MRMRLASALEKLRRNDRDAWAALYEANVDGIYRYALFRCGNDVHAAEEIAQETFLAAVDKIGSFAGDEAKLPGWLFGVARIEVLRRFRRRDRVMDGAVSFDDIAEPEAETAPDDGGLVDRALAKLPEAQGKALAFKYCDGLSVEEVAARMGRTTKSVESLLFRARESFKKLYSQLERG